MSDNPFSFDGRIRRIEYCLSYLGCYAIQVALQFILTDVEMGSVILLLCFIPLVWFILAQGAKRCHDMGTSGWFQMIPLYFLWMMFAPGHPDRNKYGPSPKHPVEQSA
jgi:uncharacterized membrane protein YhaH (DUF805 family)